MFISVLSRYWFIIQLKLIAKAPDSDNFYFFVYEGNVIKGMPKINVEYLAHSLMF
jgi:hypothetical protein